MRGLTQVLAVALLAACLCGTSTRAAPQGSQGQNGNPRYLQLEGNNIENSISGKQVYYEEASAEPEVQQGVSQGEQTGEEVTAVSTTQRPIGITSIVTSVWDLLVSWVRGVMGLQRHDPPRMARAILGAAAGDTRCWETTACQAGRMMRSLREKELIFMMMERASPPEWKGVVKTMRRSANDYNADCYSYNCVA